MGYLLPAVGSADAGPVATSERDPKLSSYKNRLFRSLFVLWVMHPEDTHR
jgi:hypothetical protein